LLRFATAVVLALLVSPALAQSAQKIVPQSPAEVHLSFAPVVKKAQPAVVNVYASRVEQRQQNPLFDDPIFRRFFGGQGDNARTAQSLGSGVIVDPSGLIVTNHHVIEGMTDVKVALSDHREFEAEIVLRDPRTDLAVLKIKGAGEAFPMLELGDSDAIEVGDFVIAIGNPFGVGQTVTQGIISALARTQAGISDYGFFIQTDAAINPGNSGGALVDLNGRLVGINSAIYSRSGGSMGIGFAIPVNMVKGVVAAAKGGGKAVKRPWLGAALQNVSKDIADTIGLDRPVGALVASLTEGGPAEEAGLKRGDVILAVDGQTVDDSGGVVLPLNLVAAPEKPPRDAIKIKTLSPFQGAVVMNLSPAVAEELSLENAHEGVVVADVPEGSTAANVGVQKGDLILVVNGQKIATTRDLEKASATRPDYWKLTIGRGGEVIQTVIGG
jgi:S1-C subfamily serine protease